MEEKNKHYFESDETATARIQQAQALRAQAAEHGLRCDAFLVPSMAEWVLDMVERGDFVDPSEAIHTFMLQARELQKYPDIQRDMLNNKLDEGIATAERGELIDGRIVMEKMKERIQERLKNHASSDPAVWQKIEQPIDLTKELK